MVPRLLQNGHATGCDALHLPMAGIPSSALASLKFCNPQPLNFVEEFLEQFPKRLGERKAIHKSFLKLNLQAPLRREKKKDDSLKLQCV